MDILSLNFDAKNHIPFQIPDLEGYSYAWNNELNGFEIKFPNGELFHAENFIEQKESEQYWKYLIETENEESNLINWKNRILEELRFKNIQWTQDIIKMYGKEIHCPRYSAWYGDEGKNYSYSGIKLSPNPWNEGLIDLKQKINQVAQTEFNSVLLNWYRDGEDYMGWHSDNEKELGTNPIIASLNFGATRRFLFRNKNNKTQKIEFHLKNGSLLIMKGAIQHFWEHAAPKERAVKKSRINLTFRIIK